MILTEHSPFHVPGVGIFIQTCWLEYDRDKTERVCASCALEFGFNPTGWSDQLVARRDQRLDCFHQKQLCASPTLRKKKKTLFCCCRKSNRKTQKRNAPTRGAWIFPSTRTQRGTLKITFVISVSADTLPPDRGNVPVCLAVGRP